ncbi:2-C-methyl-D-erythritol 4-phosphate cytidylyltransferase [uncultured Solobacterium sp.]|uniref:2-C-methyl-D-erythritol 4-phosphate cytidylyltransferase n=1 Tax=uncultured Solobacterium sp. TaxID=747375 RepID=UPI0028DC8C59|nr:2-C-methyl-D-erythritol 4-phosphate cytidylyltransferase [uncultured Solobacterium sp.]
MQYSALIVAAGSGTRMKLGYNKVYAKLSDGTTILDKTLSVFLNDSDCVQIVLVTDCGEHFEKEQGRKDGRIVFASGGKTRQDSVYNGLRAVLADVVLVHDGARPFLDQESLEKIKKTMETEKAALLCVPCKDTVKHVQDGYVVETYERSTLQCAQTPQAFETDLLLTCMHKAKKDHFIGTDDTSLVEKYSDVKVAVVEGKYSNYKITTPEDMR